MCVCVCEGGGEGGGGRGHSTMQNSNIKANVITSVVMRKHYENFRVFRTAKDISSCSRFLSALPHTSQPLALNAWRTHPAPSPPQHSPGRVHTTHFFLLSAASSAKRLKERPCAGSRDHYGAREHNYYYVMSLRI